MKVKVGFFYSNVSECFLKIKNITSILVYSFCLTCFCIVLFSKININDKVIDFACNTLSNQDNIDYIQSISPVFNEDNYIIEDSIEEVIVESKEEDKLENLISEDILYTNNYDKLDDYIETEIKAVFSKELDIAILDSTSYQKIDINGVRLLNKSTERNLNLEDMYNRVISLTKKTDNILLYNTHTSESYSNSEKYQFQYDGTYRSRNAMYNMLSVSEKFNYNLKEKGFNVVVNTTPHDYGTYSSSYLRSRETILSEIDSNGNFGIMMDLHRDACANLDYAPKVNINGIDVAQCMFVIGIGSENNRNPYYEENLSLAIKLQAIANEMYPGLFRDILIKDSIYNQNIQKNSILIEVGATGNTFEEAYAATRCLSNIFDKLYID